MTSFIGLWTAVLKPQVQHLAVAILVFGRHHVVFLKQEGTSEGGAKYNLTLNKTFLSDQRIVINFQELKRHYERVKVVRQKHG